MSDAPLSAGEWDVPFEEVANPSTVPDTDVWSIQCDSVDVIAAFTVTPLGRLPVVVFDFHSSALPACDHPPRITLVGTVDSIRSIRKLVAAGCNSAIRAVGGDA